MIYYREMKVEDIKQVASLEKACFSSPWSEKAFQSALADENAYYIVAEAQGDIVGQCGYYLGYDEADISNVAVREDFRKKGIGYQLLLHLMEYGRNHGVRAFTLEVRKGNASAIALYEKCGFESVGIRPKFYQNPTEDAVIMWEKER